ncbi:hypothetical protein RBSH_05575 [Rhodopirellula baltica SH28]|uniref:Uncharacterized protein n=1 Tax=Rhodopirellula baltica SH28 TaxID=993517 RepID=K5D8H4_RHOBT|nr:hypothetical protein RBSH_05575 [Rhodopirellula baltica SH28]
MTSKSGDDFSAESRKAKKTLTQVRLKMASRGEVSAVDPKDIAGTQGNDPLL